MTDARFPDRWLSDRRLQRLTDSHFRAFVTSLTWSVSNRTNGVIEPEDLALIPNFSANAVRAFIDAGLWSTLAKGWLIVDHAVTQTSAEQLAANENQRVREREKKARQRAAKRATGSGVPGDVPGDVSGDNPGQARPGQARPGLREVLPQAAGAENQPVWRGGGTNPFDEYN